jgi:hypothetical protein
MSPLIGKSDGWQRRVSRCRRFSTLLRENEASGLLHALARDIERRLESLGDARTAWYELKRYNAVLLGEIDEALRRMRMPAPPQPPDFRADDLREAARLCLEEVQAAADIAMQRSFGQRALDLATQAERVAKGNR